MTSKVASPSVPSGQPQTDDGSHVLSRRYQQRQFDVRPIVPVMTDNGGPDGNPVIVAPPRPRDGKR